MIFYFCFFRQNEQTFREKTGAFRKIIKKHAELGKFINNHFILFPTIIEYTNWYLRDCSDSKTSMTSTDLMQ